MRTKLLFLATIGILSGVVVLGCIIVDGDGFYTKKIYGSGDVLYKGRPQISESITGSGKVKDRN